MHDVPRPAGFEAIRRDRKNDSHTGVLAALGLLLVGLASCTASADRAGTSSRAVAAGPPADARVSASAAAQPSSAQTFVFVCEDHYQFVARVEDGRAWVFRPEGTLGLDHVATASGAKYSDGAATLWRKGEEAFLEEGEVTHRQCRNDRRRAVWEHAKLNGTDFRAVGNEPGWSLEIVDQSTIVLVTDYGGQRHRFPLPAPSVDPVSKITRYQALEDGHELTLVLYGRPCHDTMSGEAFETQVVARLDGRELRGCGRALH